jgi:hypothetical protein
VDDRDKEMLLRVRPWAADREDEEQTKSLPPELVRQQKEFNARVHDELAAIPVPTALRDQILARRKILRVSNWRRATPLLALAAAMVFLAAGLFYWLRPREDLTIAGFRSRMVGFAVREYRMDVLTKDLDVLKRFLAAKGDPAQFTLPPQLAKLPLKGGADLRWQDKPVSMVCFSWTATETLYMFVLSQALADPDALQPQQVRSLNTITWKADGKTFLLAGPIPENRLAELAKS